MPYKTKTGLKIKIMIIIRIKKFEKQNKYTKYGYKSIKVDKIIFKMTKPNVRSLKN